VGVRTYGQYCPIARASELLAERSEVMLALQRWGSQWAELTPEHAHPGVVL